MNAFRSITTLAVLWALALAACGAVAAQEISAKVVLHAPLRMLDPVLTNSYITRNHGYLIYDTLFAMDAQGHPQPQMVDSWTLSQDQRVYRFALREGLKFHDGTAVTAQDVVASLQRWSKRDPMGTRLMANSQGLVALDATHFELTLLKPYGLTLETLAKEGSPVPFIMPARIAATPPSQPIKEFIGSGPYRFMDKEFQPGIRASYVKFDGYVPRKDAPSNFAGAKVALVDRLQIVSITDSQTAVNALKNGEIDFIEDVIPDLLSQLDGVPGIRTSDFGDSSNMFTLRMNWLQPPFNNVATRRAALMALRQVDYLDAQIGDAQLYRTCGAVLSCMSPYASEENAPQLGVPDIERARQLLKDSGYKGEKVVILHPTDLPSLSSFAPITAQALSSIGMNVEIRSMDWTTLLSQRTNKAPVANGGWSIFHSNFSSLDLVSPVANPNLDGRGESGYPGWSLDPQMEALRSEFAQQPDIAKRQELAAQIQRRAMDQVFVVPLGTYSKHKAYNSKLDDMPRAPLPLFWHAHP